ncbi:Uncharacterised protein [uncultured archaeon]|nr:Uncharacterised protein [uncultured archaeon]
MRDFERFFSEVLNLSVGYYELNVSIIKYDKKDIKAFYILNASDK